MGRWALALPTFSWATCFWPPQVPTSLLIGGLCVCFWRLSLCLDSLLSQNPTSCFPHTLQLHIQRALPVHTAPLMPLTCPALGTPCPCQPGFGPQELLGCQFKSQTPTGLHLRLQHPAWRVLFPLTTPPPHAQLQLQPPCCAPGKRLAGVGGTLSPLASPLYITSASIQIPLGSGKGGLFVHFFSRGNNSTSCHMDFCI